MSRYVDMHLAQLIMGSNFLGPEEIRRGFGITFSKSQKKRMEHVPFTEEMLRACAQSHMLVLGVPRDNRGRRVTINYFRALAKQQQWGPMHFFNRDTADFVYQDSWSQFQKFATKRVCDFGWYLVSKSIRDSTRNQSFQEGKNLIEAHETVKPAIVYLYAMLLYARIHGYRYGVTPFFQDTIWTSDSDSDTLRVYVGQFNPSGPQIGRYSGRNGFPNMGFSPCVRGEL